MKILCHYKLGNGEQISLWHDKWCYDHSLNVEFPMLYQICTDPDITVAKALEGGTITINFRRQLSSSQHLDFYNLQLILLHHQHLLTAVPDIVQWTCTADGIFSTKSLYTWLDNRGVSDNYCTKLWQLKIPLKIKCFLWLVVKRKILTKDSLLLRGFDVPYNCAYCTNLETCDHLFFLCSNNRKIWEWFLSKCQVRICPSSLEDLGVLASQFGGIQLHAFYICCAAILWFMWKERNTYIFEGKSIKDFANRCADICYILQYWSGLWKASLYQEVAKMMPVGQQTLHMQLPHSGERVRGDIMILT